MNKSESIAKLATALLKAQQGMSNASKDAKNPFFKSKYADLNSIREVTIPRLNEAGVVVTQPLGRDAYGFYVETTLIHSESGEWMSSQTPVICAKQNDPQALGSAVSYARRYDLQSLMCVGAEDSDAEGAMDRSVAAPKAAEKAPVVKSSFRPPVTQVEGIAAAAKTAVKKAEVVQDEWN